MSFIVLRYGELFLKGANRGRFESVLLENLRHALRDLSEVKLIKGQGRVFVDCPAADVERAAGRLGRVFGLSSLSPAEEVPQEVKAMGRVASEQVQQALKQGPVGSFRIKARRSDKRFALPSPEINRQVGQAVVDATGLSVDLGNADLTVGVEVGPLRSFVFTRRLAGAGGLPVGVSGKVALLLSGGIDSPVAGHLMQKRGCRLDAVYFHSFPYTGERTKAKVQQLAEVLAPAQKRLLLHVVPFTEIQKAIRDGAPSEMAVILYRRSMMRIASAIARRRACPALATGENLGQVASQTLENLVCIQGEADRPVLRPLVAFDKAETIALARHIGTYELSIQPYEDCCSLFVPKHPVTRGRLKNVVRAEDGVEGLAELEQEAVGATEEVVVEG